MNCLFSELNASLSIFLIVVDSFTVVLPEPLSINGYCIFKHVYEPESITSPL